MLFRRHLLCYSPIHTYPTGLLKFETHYPKGDNLFPKYLLNFILSPAAQAQTTMVHYAPLPKEVIDKAQKALSEITYNGKSL